MQRSCIGREMKLRNSSEKGSKRKHLQRQKRRHWFEIWLMQKDIDMTVQKRKINHRNWNKKIFVISVGKSEKTVRFDSIRYEQSRHHIWFKTTSKEEEEKKTNCTSKLRLLENDRSMVHMRYVNAWVSNRLHQIEISSATWLMIGAASTVHPLGVISFLNHEEIVEV